MSYPAQQQGTATATATAPSSGYGVPGPTNLGTANEPPGYQQNVNAPGIDSYQQRSAFIGNESSGAQAGEAEGVWDSAKKWASATGSKLAAAESEVWKRITKE